MLMNRNHNPKFVSVEQIQKGFVETGYVCSRQIATTLYVAYHLEKPILIEGPAGVGKTELGKIMAAYLDLPLIRLQCYEGLDDSKALYEWKYGKQLLYTQILKDRLNGILKDTMGLAEAMDKLHKQDDLFFSTHFLEPRPLLAALQKQGGSVLLVDEVDKSDEEFEAFLLEILSDFQVTIPEIGTILAETKPFVFLTSNNSREISEPLKRRCLHLYIPLPTAKLEREILRVHVPDLSESLRIQLVSFIQQVRELDLKKLPSISETIDWAKVMLLHHSTALDRNLIRDTLNTFLKFEEDIEAVTDHIYEIERKARKEALG
jgi:MoxR-like ATPase